MVCHVDGREILQLMSSPQHLTDYTISRLTHHERAIKPVLARVRELFKDEIAADVTDGKKGDQLITFFTTLPRGKNRLMSDVLMYNIKRMEGEYR